LSNLASITTFSANFYFWISHGGVDNFALDKNFLDETYVPMHFIVGLFQWMKLINPWLYNFSLC
jgi:hypothetical protein